MPDTADTVDVADVVDYFLRRDDAEGPDADVTPMKLQKLLYLAQANYLASTGQRLFDENLLAYKDGPVVRKVWREYRGTATTLVHSGIHAPTQVDLPPLIEDFLDKVWARWSPLSASALRNLTHEQDPWKNHYIHGEHHIKIPDEDMADYFTSKVPSRDRIYPIASFDNVIAEPSDDEPWATGMFARPADGVIRLPVRKRTHRSARAKQGHARAK